MNSKVEKELHYKDSSMLQQIGMWFFALRPKTLTLSLTPILMGTFLAFYFVEKIEWLIVAMAAISAIFIQIGTNLVNDALDFKKGADEQRIGPRRLTQMGIIPAKTVLMTGFFCFVCALMAGIPLVIHGGWPLLVLLIASVVSGYLYTGGPFPLAYCGLGELFVVIFFGLASTTAAFYLQTGNINEIPVLVGFQLGLLAVVPIAINNLRDIVGDSKVDKKTLAVRFGNTFARIEITISAFLPFCLGGFWFAWGHPLAALAPCLLIPMTYQNIKGIWKGDASPAYHEFLAKSALIQLLFASLLILGYLA